MPDNTAPSLENLIESLDLGMEVLHPGGFDTTRELAALCHVREGSRILDVASGTGSPLCYLVETLHCQGVGVDGSEAMVRKAQAKGLEQHLDVEFRQGDAHHLPFDADTFDAAISECTLCILDKLAALREMVRVVKPGGYVGFHDLCWQADTPDSLKRRLAEIEEEYPETPEGWKRLATEAGLVDVVDVVKANQIPQWSRDFKRRLGIFRQLSAFWYILRRWGWRGLWRIKESEGIFASPQMGYCLIAGRKP